MKLIYFIMAFFAFQIARIFVPSGNTYSIYTMENIYHVDGKRLYDERGDIDTTFRFKSDLDVWLEDRTAHESQLQNTSYLQWAIEAGHITIDVIDNTKYDWYDLRDPSKSAHIVYHDRDSTYEIGYTNMIDTVGGVEHYYFLD